MKRKNISILGCLFVGLIAVSASHAGWVDVNLAPDYWKYKQKYPGYEGYLENTTINGNGACAATSMINSFWYLQNEFPTIYTTGHKLLPDDNLTDARNSLHKRIWAGGSFSDIWEEKIKWFERYNAPGVFKGMYYNSVDGWYKPDGLIGNNWPTWDFLWKELSHKEDIEIFVENSYTNHVLTLTSLHFNDKNNNKKWDIGEERKIDYLDSNTPWKFTTKDLRENSDGSLGFQNLEGVTLDAVWIYGAFSESVPEPATVLLLGLGGIALFRRRRG